MSRTRSRLARIDHAYDAQKVYDALVVGSGVAGSIIARPLPISGLDRVAAGRINGAEVSLAAETCTLMTRNTPPGAVKSDRRPWSSAGRHGCEDGSR
ncbi:MAG: hypothetical protein AB1635_10955 [Acidobacteriota bacterium]